MQVVIPPGEYFDVPVGVEHEDIVGDEGLILGAATKEFGLGLVFKTLNFTERVKSLFGLKK